MSSTKGAVERGAHVLALTNQEASPVEEHAHQTLPILAGPEVAVPATKTVIASIAAGLAILGQLAPEYRDTFYPAIQAFERLKERLHPRLTDLQGAERGRTCLCNRARCWLWRGTSCAQTERVLFAAC